MTVGEKLRIEFSKGKHKTIHGNPCAGLEFTVVSIGGGGVYETRVQCGSCATEFDCYGGQILDPLAEAFLEEPEESSFAVRITYRFSHQSANGCSETPTLWFKSHSSAMNAFRSVTRDSAEASFMPASSSDTLESATVKLLYVESRIGS